MFITAKQTLEAHLKKAMRLGNNEAISLCKKGLSLIGTLKEGQTYWLNAHVSLSLEPIGYTLRVQGVRVEKLP